MINFLTLKELIKKGESETLEFKETFRYNIETNLKDKSLKDEISKAICGVLNSDGGFVLIGVADDKSIIGIERDLNLYGGKNESNQIDKLLIDLNAHITDRIGIKSKRFLEIEIASEEGVKIVKIKIIPSKDPFFHSKEENFYIRDGPRTIKLSNREMGEYISDRVKESSSKSTEKVWQDKIEKISSNFQKWVKNKLEENRNLRINVGRYDGYLYDYIFGCVVPDTISDDLIDFKSNLIKNFIDDYSIIRSPQTYKTPEYARQYDLDNGQDIVIYPNGIIYFCINYSFFNPNIPEFSLGYLNSDSYQTLLDVETHQEVYNAPFSRITWGNLESLFEVLCFIFNPVCRIDIVKKRTKSFWLEIIVPDMIFNGKRRILSQGRGIIPTHKKYLGEKKDIIFRESFEYDSIFEFVTSIKKRITEFFQNPADTAYSY